MTKHIISSSDMGSLHFETNEEYEAYKKDEILLFFKYYTILTLKHGHYAGNQGKYVPSIKDFNDFDPQPHPIIKLAMELEL